jgi:hypothetical protein
MDVRSDGSTILFSPEVILSLNGKKIAFVDTAWNSAAVPGDCSAGNS